MGWDKPVPINGIVTIDETNVDYFIHSTIKLTPEEHQERKIKK
jgi:hypothetical protein